MKGSKPPRRCVMSCYQRAGHQKFIKIIFCNQLTWFYCYFFKLWIEKNMWLIETNLFKSGVSAFKTNELGTSITNPPVDKGSILRNVLSKNNSSGGGFQVSFMDNENKFEQKKKILSSNMHRAHWVITDSLLFCGCVCVLLNCCWYLLQIYPSSSAFQGFPRGRVCVCVCGCFPNVQGHTDPSPFVQTA